MRDFKGKEGKSHIGEKEQRFRKQVFGYTETEEHRGEPNKQAFLGSSLSTTNSCYTKVIAGFLRQVFYLNFLGS